MSSIVLTLGGVSFQDMEVPEAISFGGAQRLSAQRLLGGGRVLNALGFDDGDISFSGIFSGPAAVERAQILDAARVAGLALPLAWDRFFYVVVISKFSASYHKTSLIPFSLTCSVVDDPAARLAQVVPAAAGLVARDLANAVALSAQAGMPASGLASADLAGLNSMQGDIQNAIQSCGAVLGNAVAGINGTNDVGQGVGTVMAALGASSALAALAGMGQYVSRGTANLQGALP